VGCDQESIEKAKTLWQETLQNHEKASTYTIDMTNLASFGIKI